ncbi:MAG: hypothetical protein WCP36_03520 [Methanomicrobiales archaeon]
MIPGMDSYHSDILLARVIDRFASAGRRDRIYLIYQPAGFSCICIRKRLFSGITVPITKSSTSIGRYKNSYEWTAR